MRKRQCESFLSFSEGYVSNQKMHQLVLKECSDKPILTDIVIPVQPCTSLSSRLVEQFFSVWVRIPLSALSFLEGLFFSVLARILFKAHLSFFAGLFSLPSPVLVARRGGQLQRVTVLLAAQTTHK